MVTILREASDVVCTEMSWLIETGMLGEKVRVQAFTDIHDIMDT